MPTSGGGGVACELGCNRGLNLIALHTLYPNLKLTGIEINKKAYEEMKRLEYVEAINASIYDFKVNRQFDLAFVCGVLIHQNPKMLPLAYQMLYDLSSKYILISEYYNPTPVEVKYRGNDGVLFKRDFAGEFMDRFNDVSLADYGFCYHKDTNFNKDDMNWFLLEKR